LGYIYALAIPLASGGPGHDLFASIYSTVQQKNNHWTNSTDLICQPSDSPFFIPSSENCPYKYDQVVLKSTPQPFRDGFFKSTCFMNPIDDDPDSFCIFINPALNGGKGMVIVAPEGDFEQYLGKDIDLSIEPRELDTMRTVDMPEKGGKGAVASRDIQAGEDIALMRPLALFPLGQTVWSTRFGQNVRRQAVDHLPLHSRAAVAGLHGEGKDGDEFISDLIHVNTFMTHIQTEMPIGAVVVEASRLNHACRPNVVYNLDPRTQLLNMKAIRPIEKGEELTISYVEEFLNICDMEQIPSCMVTANQVAAEFYNSRGEKQKVKEYAEVARKIGLINYGSSWDELEELELLIIDVEPWTNSTNICEPRGGFAFSSSSVYKYDQAVLRSTPQPFRDGFFKSTCFLDPTDKSSEEFCIFFNPTISNGQGMVIVAPEEVLVESLEDGLDLSDDPPEPDTIEVVAMPEKGGMGAVAAHDIDAGDHVAFYVLIRRQAIDHLPIRTRAAIARLHGEGKTEDEFISSLIDVNTFTSFLKTTMNFGAVVLVGSRLNHACRPNVFYRMDPRAQVLYLKAFKPIFKGEELTISYRSLESTSQDRRESLEETYGFVCTCSHCQMSVERRKQSDQRVSRITELRQKSLSDDSNFSAEEVEEFFDLCKTENIPSCMLTANMIAAEFYNSEGKIDKVKECAEVARKIGLITLRMSRDELQQIEMLINSPEKHHSYLSVKQKTS
ncbi:hypothetical protein PSTT_11771, partial [Puccinia striiformis]